MHVAACTYNQHQQNLHLRGNSSLAHGPTPSTISNAKGPHNEETMVVQLWPKHPSLPPPEGSSTGVYRLLSDDLYDRNVFSFQCWTGVNISKKWVEMLHVIRMYTYIHSSWELKTGTLRLSMIFKVSKTKKTSPFASICNYHHHVYLWFVISSWRKQKKHSTQYTPKWIFLNLSISPQKLLKW